MSITDNSEDISVAALGDNERGVYAFHLVNNEASRKVTITGIPSKIKSFKLFITDQNENMKEHIAHSGAWGIALIMIALYAGNAVWGLGDRWRKIPVVARNRWLW